MDGRTTEWDDEPVTDAGGGPGSGERGLPAGLGRHRAPERTARWDPGRLGSRSLWIAGLAAALVLVAWTWLDRPRVEPAPARPAGSAASTSVPPQPTVGEVADDLRARRRFRGRIRWRGPGWSPSRRARGWPTPSTPPAGCCPAADPASVNLAAVVTDGQQIAVGVPGRGAPAARRRRRRRRPPGGQVNLNTATAADLDALPGHRPVLAQRIVDYRDQQGRSPASTSSTTCPASVRPSPRSSPSW